MNEELNNNFNEYLETFKQLNIPQKRMEIIHAVNEITASFDMLASEANVKLSHLKSKETFDLKEGYESEDDYLEALLVYVENAKSVLGEYLLKMMNE